LSGLADGDGFGSGLAARVGACAWSRTCLIARVSEPVDLSREEFFARGWAQDARNVELTSELDRVDVAYAELAVADVAAGNLVVHDRYTLCDNKVFKSKARAPRRRRPQCARTMSSANRSPSPRRRESPRTRSWPTIADLRR
jgi:hypothetical protein